MHKIRQSIRLCRKRHCLHRAFGDNKPSGILKTTTTPNNAVTQDATTTALLRATTPTLKFNLRYPGQYFDEESNLNYNYQRSYQFGQGRYSQSDPIGLDGGWNRFGYVGGNALSLVDPEGLLSASEALAHYLGGTGTALDMDFSEIPTYFVKPTDFPKLNAAINGACFDQKISIDDRTAFASFMKWLTVGNITLRLQGTLIKKCDCSWNFSGHIKSFDDVYDFNESNHRSNVGENLTTVGRLLPGKEYAIRIRGSKPISQKGRSRGVPTCDCDKN